MILAFGALGCGGHGARGVHPGTMPAGGSFHGAWLSPEYGDMHLCLAGGHIIGSYEKGDRSGEIRGEVDGDVLWFEWSERREYVPGAPIENAGRGYFRLTINEDGDAVITGEWGHGEDRTGGGPWTAVKRRRAGPDSCDGSAAVTTGRDVSWDEDEPEGGTDPEDEEF